MRTRRTRGAGKESLRNVGVGGGGVVVGWDILVVFFEAVEEMYVMLMKTLTKKKIYNRM